MCDWKYCKNIKKYFGKNPMFNGATHVLAGIGVGILITYPWIGIHPVRWGIAFLVLATLGHLWAAMQK